MSTVGNVKPAVVPVGKPIREVSLKTRQTRLAWMMLLPTLVVVALVAMWPLIQTIYQSFTDARFNSVTPTSFIGLRNYSDLLKDSLFRSSIGVAVKFAVVTVICEFLLGLVIALVVNSNFKGRGITRAAMLIPWAMITVVSAQMWKFMFDQNTGVVNDLLYARIAPVINTVLPSSHHILTGTPVAWLAQDNTAFWAVCVVDIWKTSPFVALLLLAGLQVIPADVYEAATVDGAGGWQQFTRITLPLLRPAIAVTLIFRTLDALRVFDVFYVMTGTKSTTTTMAIYAYQNLIPFFDYGYGSAISVAIFIIIAVFVIAYVTILKVEEAS
jgi:trehalose/maltose transport system permease protein